MNVDEARVPNVDADWSIEIFLFSNGQKFSPPRKYYLRADELNSWEATLNHLATSHYGLQCPRISLYTTDGQLVEGPLGLNGGQAYVAVVEPDIFVDTGYQKYLIRASRSWEKRQARKKVRECVPGDPCCLCPEKEWCCDPQKCCECLEIEDSYSQCLLLAVSENMELRPADGHYMSSTPAKPVTTGDYGPSPAEYGYSPVPAPAKPDQYGAGFNVNGVNPAEEAPKLSGNGPRPGEYRVRSDESETKVDENTGRPGEYGAKLNQHGSRLSQNGEKPVEYLATLSENEPRLSKDVVKSGAYGPRPGENIPRPADYETRPSRNGARPDECGAKPGEYGARPDKNVAKSDEHETKPSRNGVRSDEYGARPGAYKPKPIGKGPTPDKHGAKPGEYETRTNRNEARPSEHGAKPGEYKSRPSVNRAKPREYVPRASANGDKLSEHGVIPSEHETRPSVNKAQPGEYGTKPGKYTARPSEYETRSSVNGVRPDEHEARPGEHETRPSINRAKPGDPGARPGKTEVWPGEDVVKPTVYGSRAEVEHTRRISEQRDTEIQQGGRTGEPTREFGEFDHGGRLSQQKGRESSFAGRACGQRARENEARLSKQRIRQSDLLPRPDGRESKLGDIDARLGHHGLRSIDHNIILGNPASRVTETSSRTSAPVSRPIPRDRINSRVRTSDLGQLKSRTPTRVDETAARLDDSGIKNTVGHPGARPGSAGGTAAAGALHISEAQQHTRRSSFFAGRPSTEKKRLPIGQNSSLLKKPTLISSALRKLEDKQPIKTKQEILTKKTNQSVPASTDVIKSKTMPECTQIELTPLELPLPTISVTNAESLTTNKAPLENIIDETELLIVSKHSFYIKDPGSEITPSIRLDSVKHFVDVINNFRKETQTEIIYVGKSSPTISVNVEVQTSTGAVDTKQQAQDESASNKATVGSDTFQYSTEAVDTKQHTQEESLNNKLKVDLDTFQYSTEAVDTKQHAQEESLNNKLKVDLDTFQTSTGAVDTKQHTQEESLNNKLKVELDTFQYSTGAVDTKQHAQEESLNNKLKVDLDTFQYSTGAVDTKQHAQEDSASNKVKVNSDTYCLCSQRDHKLATGDPDENTIPIVYQGDGGTINLKLDIKIRNIVKPVYSCQKNCQGVRSVTNIMTSEKESQISIVDNFLLRRDSLNSLFHKTYSRGFDFSPNVMVVQCAGCRRLNNPPRCDQPQCCDNSKKYFMLLTNSVNEDEMDESCDGKPPCRPCDLRQTQLKRQSTIIPVKKSYSDLALDTITTVTVSGVPLQNWEMKKCNVKESTCQTEETHDCMISKHKVSITEESVTTPTSEIQKKSSSSFDILTTKRSRLKIVQEICPEIKEHEVSLVCSQTDPVPCRKVPSACTKTSSHTCSKVQSMGCQQTCPPVQTQGCSPVSSICPSCHPVPLACIQIQTHVCPHVPQVSNRETQTQWRSLVLQARLHCDGRYSFHLPPLNVLNNFPF